MFIGWLVVVAYGIANLGSRHLFRISSCLHYPSFHNTKDRRKRQVRLNLWFSINVRKLQQGLGKFDSLELRVATIRLWLVAPVVSLEIDCPLPEGEPDSQFLGVDDRCGSLAVNQWRSLNDCFLLSARMLHFGEPPGSQVKSLYFRDWGQFGAHIHLQLKWAHENGMRAEADKCKLICR